MKQELHHADCFDIFPSIANHSVDMVLCDLPYGVTRSNQWDQPLDLDALWKAYHRIVKPNGAIVLFAQGKFAHQLKASNLNEWRYDLIWDKQLPGGFLNANVMPLRVHEDICIFYRKKPTYHPQKVEGKPNHGRGSAAGKLASVVNRNQTYGNHQIIETDTTNHLKHPKSILSYAKPHPSIALHPTEKPVDLCEWLIRTFTNEGEVVLDNCCGSGSTLIAALRSKRQFIGIEKNDTFYQVAYDRLQKEKEGNK